MAMLSWNKLTRAVLYDRPKVVRHRSFVALTGAVRKKAAPVGPVGRVVQHYSVQRDEYYAVDSIGQRFTLNRDTMEWTLCTTP